MRLTRGRLLQQTDWEDWQHSEYLQLNQYSNQGCFGEPTAIDKEDAVFHLVWTYNIKVLNGRKKARCICDGSSRSGLVKVLDEVYANFVDQTSSRLFYAMAAPKTSSCLAPMFAMHSPRHHPQSKDSTFIQTVLSTSGGSTIKVVPRFHQVTSSRSYQQCKDTPSLLVCGKNMPTPASSGIGSPGLTLSITYLLTSLR
jgi:hypothetical protein